MSSFGAEPGDPTTPPSTSARRLRTSRRRQRSRQMRSPSPASWWIAVVSFDFPSYYRVCFHFLTRALYRRQFIKKPPQPTSRHRQHLRAARSGRAEYHRRDDRVAHQRGPPGRAPSRPIRTQTRCQHHRRLCRLGEHRQNAGPVRPSTFLSLSVFRTLLTILCLIPRRLFR